MKKIIIMGISFFSLLASCSNGGKTRNENVKANNPTDTACTHVQNKDSIESVLVKDSAATPQPNDKTKEEANDDFSQCDPILKQYESAVNQYRRFVKNPNSDYSRQAVHTTKCRNLYMKLKKMSKKLSDEQRKKFKKLHAQYEDAYYSING